ncbi:Hydroxyisourate hydrolase [Heracleum sosnowskyi]|uniref:Hydroxyisourate hydrolase n=1 Tax=Heracleum sosnowskyi TaxID=360622 RepID=A0AAD8NBD6_9APIA|nr:Hydroxyisourate hydrolase [Heracleum sosnowskyi]
MESVFGEADYLACCGSHKFAKHMVEAGPFSSPQLAISAATHIWFNQVDVTGWLEAFSAHPQIGQSPSHDHKSPTSAQWSKGEQSTAIATATDSTLQELYDWNTCYRKKFGFVFLICASGRSTPEILAELKRRYSNRPLVEFEIAAQEQMKITELRLHKLFSVAANTPTSDTQFSTGGAMTKAEEERVCIIGSHLASATPSPSTKPSQVSTRTRPPITTHVLDIARGRPASGIEVSLEMWKTDQRRPVFGDFGTNNWTFQGSSTTDKDGRSGHLMTIVDALNPGIYRISFNTGKYNPDGFFPFVSIVFEIRESQKLEHFHVPLLLSPFSYSTYRGS